MSMEFLAANWIIFLIVSVIFYAITIILQIKKMKNMSENFYITHSTNGMFKGFILVVLCSLLGTFSFILFLIGVIIAVSRTL